MSPTVAAIPTHDGLVLAAEDHVPADARAHVVIVHGFGEHKGRYAHVAAALNAAGYACHLFDARGHGASQGVRGHVASFADFRDDLDRVTAHVRTTERRRDGARDAGSPLVVLGHSLGGLIALDYVLHRPGAFAALVVSSPSVGLRLPVLPLVRLAAAVLGRLAPELRLGAGLSAELLSHDADVVRDYVQDARVVRHLTARLLREILAAQRRVLERAGEIRLASLFLVAGDDRVVDASRTYEAFRRLGSADKRLVTYQGFFHEVLGEIGKDAVLAEVRGWLDARFAG